jgi:hypothetical protein
MVFGLIIEIVELGVAIFVIAAFMRFAIALQAVAHAAQQFADNVRTNAMLLLLQRGRQMTQAFRCPQQGLHRIAPRHWLHQCLQVIQQAVASWSVFFFRQPPGLRPKQTLSKNQKSRCAG